MLVCLYKALSTCTFVIAEILGGITRIVGIESSVSLFCAQKNIYSSITNS